MPKAGKNLFFSKNGIVDEHRFATDLAKLRSQLREASTICNLQQDRYLFSLGIVAALLNGQDSVLPPSSAPEAILASISNAISPVLFSQNTELDDLNSRIAFSAGEGLGEPVPDISACLAESPAEIRVFSSGSTKTPKCNIKTWKMLCGGAAVTDQILRGLDADSSELGLLGTTPPGHMYGLESTIFTALGFDHCSYRNTIFFPADLEQAIEDARLCGLTKLVLITSPAHLRFLEPTILAAPEIICVLSATAPFPRRTAAKLAERDNLRVMEIYGSTETGAMALRQTAFEEHWTLSTGFELHQTAHGHVVSAAHLPSPVLLEDDIEMHQNGVFRLLGRLGDMVRIRGKRSSLAALNAVLSECQDISDGLFIHVKADDSDRLAAVVVARSDSNQTQTELRTSVQRHLLRHLDAAFVPKKFVFLDHIPRSPTGKVVHTTVTDLIKKAELLG